MIRTAGTRLPTAIPTRLLAGLTCWFRAMRISKKLQRITGQGFWNGVQRERVNNWVVEVVSKDKDYIYSKQIWYLDPETWQMNFKIMYNRQGELWKTYEMFYNEYPTVQGQKAAYMSAEHTIDLIRHHGSPSKYTKQVIGVNIPISSTRLRRLKKRPTNRLLR